ncbi:MAG: hypothetical protein WCP16_08900 [Pseudanabaena sp. ELA645]|jgi:hypothetical protein
MQRLFWSLGLLTYMALTGIQPAFAIPSISTNITSSASRLPLDGGGRSATHIVKVSTLSLSTDSNKGFTLTISSGSLAKVEPQSPIIYQVTTVESGAGSPSSGDFSITSGNNYTFLSSQAGSQNRDLYILYSPSNLQTPGTYSSNIIVSISDNP